MTVSNLLGSEALDVAIGLILFFLFASLICAALQEGFEAILRTRAMGLERAVRELLADRDGTGLTKELFKHPMIAGLFPRDYDPSKLNGKEGDPLRLMRLLGRRNLPAYVPAQQFVSALVDHVVNGAIGSVPAGGGAPPALTAAALRGAAAKLNNEVGRAIITALDAANEDLTQTRKELESWFDAAMQRVGGAYKRRAQTWLFFMGLAAAVILNLDALTVLERLSKDKALRAAALTAATEVAKRDPAEEQAPGAGGQDGTGGKTQRTAPQPSPGEIGKGDAPKSDAPKTDAPKGDAANARPPNTGAPAGGDAGPVTDVKKAAATVTQLSGDLTAIGYPIGWTADRQKMLWVSCGAPEEDGKRLCAGDRRIGGVHFGGKKDAPATILLWGPALMMALGWLITALATMLGANFWFDTLNRFMNVRSTVKPDEARKK